MHVQLPKKSIFYSKSKIAPEESRPSDQGFSTKTEEGLNAKLDGTECPFHKFSLLP